MTDDDWQEWAESHSTVFGMRFAEDLQMVASWRRFLDGYSLSELHTATGELAKNFPRSREQHITALLRILASRRAATSMAYVEQSKHEVGQPMACSMCGGGGTVMVPHPRCMVDGEYIPGPGGYKATAAVFCDCNTGRRKLATFSLERPMTLAEYETRYGQGWPDLLVEAEKERRGKHQMQMEASHVDKMQGPLKRSREEILAELQSRMNPKNR
jgi:hypothetical protein